MVPSPPPRLPVAQGAFFRSYPRRAAKGASLKRVLLSREWKGGSARAQGVRCWFHFSLPAKAVWLGAARAGPGCQGPSG